MEEMCTEFNTCYLHHRNNYVLENEAGVSLISYEGKYVVFSTIGLTLDYFMGEEPSWVTEVFEVGHGAWSDVMYDRPRSLYKNETYNPEDTKELHYGLIETIRAGLFNGMDM